MIATPCPTCGHRPAGRRAHAPATDDARLVAAACEALGCTRDTLAARIGAKPPYLSRPLTAKVRAAVQKELDYTKSRSKSTQKKKKDILAQRGEA